MFKIKTGLSIFNSCRKGKPDDLWRCLSPKERVFLELGETKLQFSGIMFVSSKYPLLESKIEQSLLCIAKRHPLLHACVTKKNNRYFWKRMDDIKVLFKVHHTTNWHDVITETLNHKYDWNKGPLWQMVYLPKVTSEFADTNMAHHSAFVFSANHAVMDGIGTHYFYRELRDLLIQLHDNDDDALSEIVDTRTLGVPNGLDYYTRREMPTTYKVLDILGTIPPFSNIWRYMVNISLRNSDPFYSLYGSSDSDGTDVQTKIIPVVIDETYLSLISAACKSEQVGIHAAMQTACKRAMKEIIREKATERGTILEFYPKAQTKILSGKPHFEQNNYCSTEESYAKAFAWPMIDYIDMDMGSDECGFWLKAKHEAQFMKATREKARIKNYFTSKFVDTQLYSKLPNEARTFMLPFSNVGKVEMLDNKPDSAIKFIAQFNATSEHFRGSAISNTCVTFDNKLFWTVVYFPPITDRAFAQSYIHKSLHILLQECRQKLSEF